ncbi:MAG: hypothetical protein DRH32_00230 [Deltaproteobacteria bacterium]|nr:MAG: hypothetical protein DRH32_00230 [Deltaproteobacteria bacterium]
MKSDNNFILRRHRMPIYEYRCRDCGSTSEFLMDMGNDMAVACRLCGSRAMERIMSSASVVMRSRSKKPGYTCCGRAERCDKPPCSETGTCRHG